MFFHGSNYSRHLGDRQSETAKPRLRDFWKEWAGGDDFSVRKILSGAKAFAKATIDAFRSGLPPMPPPSGME